MTGKKEKGVMNSVFPIEIGIKGNDSQRALTTEDLNYLKQLNLKSKEIKTLIGELEVNKARLLKDFETSSQTETAFIQQLYAKYDIPLTVSFTIKSDTGEIVFEKTEA